MRRSAAAQAHTAFGRWVEAQLKNAWRLAKASDLRQKRREVLQKAAKLRRADSAKYRRTPQGDAQKRVRTTPHRTEALRQGREVRTAEPGPAADDAHAQAR